MDASDAESRGAALASWARAHARSLAAAAALLLLYTLAGFVLVPRLARSAVVDYVQGTLRRHVSIGALQFNPYTFTLEVHRFALSEADDRPIASFDLLRVSASLSASLFDRAWTLSEVRLDGPLVYARIERDGSLNLVKLAPPAKPGPQPSSPGLPALRVKALGVHGGHVQFEDRSRSEPFAATLSPIEFDLTDFRTAVKFENKYRFSAATSAGERLDWSGEFSLQPLGSSGQFAIAGLKAATIAAYLQNTIPFALTSGSLDVQGNYRFVASTPAGLSLTLPSIKIHALSIAPAASVEAPWITLPELDFDNTAVVLEQRRVAIGQIKLQHAALRLWRAADGSLNLQRLVAGPQTAQPAVASPAPVLSSRDAASAPVSTSASGAAAPPWAVTLDRLEVEDASVEAEDRASDPVVKLNLQSIGLTVQNFSSTAATPLNFTLQMGIGDEGRLQTHGTLSLSPLSAALDLELSEFDLPPLQPYLSQATAIALYRGRLGVKGHVAYSGSPARGEPQLALNLAVDVTNLATRDNTMNEDLLSWRSLHIEGLRYQLAPDRLSIARIEVREPYARVVIAAKGGLNVTAALQPGGASASASAGASAGAGASASASAAAAAAPARGGATGATARHPAAKVATAPVPAAAQPMPTRIDRIDIRDGVADFTDHSVTPTFSAAINALHGSIAGLSTDPASRASVDLQGSVDRYAPVSIKGELNVLSAATYTDITMSFANIELTTFNPYSGKFAGYNISQGKLSTDMHYHVEDRKLDAKHHVEIDQLEFGDATESKQAVPLPIKLAASLLKDRNGVINLDLPVGGSLDDPTFRIGPIIWKLVVGLITKIATAPFALLGSLFGGDQELSYIDFPAGEATLGPTQTQQLTQLARALTERPQLKLDIPLHTLNDADDAALEHAALEQALLAAPAAPAHTARPRAAAAKGTAVSAAGARVAALSALYRAQFQDEPKYPDEISSAADPDAGRSAWLEEQLLPQFAPSSAQRDELAQARAKAAQSAVLANPELKPERVFLVNQDSGSAAGDSVRMELKLE
jgi:uncharacterized protein involved in outer membrane biogenesis/microcystin-dependent protein